MNTIQKIIDKCKHEIGDIREKDNVIFFELDYRIEFKKINFFCIEICIYDNYHKNNVKVEYYNDVMVWNRNWLALAMFMGESSSKIIKKKGETKFYKWLNN